MGIMGAVRHTVVSLSPTRVGLIAPDSHARTQAQLECYITGNLGKPKLPVVPPAPSTLNWMLLFVSVFFSECSINRDGAAEF